MEMGSRAKAPRKVPGRCPCSLWVLSFSLYALSRSQPLIPNLSPPAPHFLLVLGLCSSPVASPLLAP